MRRVYLLAYSNSFGTRDEVKALLNDLQEVITWRHDLPNAFYIVSETDARRLAELIHAKRGKGRFIVSEIGTNRQGWLTPESWYLINNKRVKPKAE